MVSKLYSADLMSEAKPVEESVQEKPHKVVKKRVKKTENETPVEAKTVETPAEAPAVPAETPAEAPAEPVKEKKPRTEKQIAALEKAKETRRLKREAMDAEIQRIKDEKEAAEKKLAEKKAAMAEKRRQKKAARESETPSLDMNGEPKPPKERKRKPVDENAPPTWFKNALSTLRDEVVGTKKLKRDELHAEAKKKWDDPLLKGRITDIQNTTAQKMYAAMFPGRRL